jgi:hypothetical protein
MNFSHDLIDPPEAGSGSDLAPSLRFQKRHLADGKIVALSVMPAGVSYDLERETYVRTWFALLESEFSKSAPVPPKGVLGFLHTDVSTESDLELDAAYEQATEFLRRHLAHFGQEYGGLAKATDIL